MTNSTPHERFFTFPRRSSSGVSTPTWLSTPSKVFLKRHVQATKCDPKVDLVELQESNGNYAQIRFNDGRETTVSTKHLAPIGEMYEDETDVTLTNTDHHTVCGPTENNFEEQGPLQPEQELQRS